MTLLSDTQFEFKYEIYSQTKAGMTFSGDNHTVFKLTKHLTGFLLSDGMGHSKKAYKESRYLINLMRNYLRQDLNPETAMHTLYYVIEKR